MTFCQLMKRVDEASNKVDMEKVAKFINKNRKEKNLKDLIKKEFSNLSDEDIEIAIEIS